MLKEMRDTDAAGLHYRDRQDMLALGKRCIGQRDLARQPHRGWRESQDHSPRRRGERKA